MPEFENVPAPYAKTQKATTTLTPSWIGRLDAYAAHHELSRADAIRRAIERQVAAFEAGRG